MPGHYPKVISAVRHEQLQELGRSLQHKTYAQLLAAFMLSVASYVVLVGYDFLALWFVRQKLALWKIALTSFISYAFSYNFGATLAGGPIRYRLYAGFKVPALKIVELLVILGLTFWFALFFLGGILLAVDPLQIPAELAAKLAQRTAPASRPALGGHRAVGRRAGLPVARPCSTAGSASGDGKCPCRRLGSRSGNTSSARADFFLAAAVLYVLLPRTVGVGFFFVLEIYILAYVAEVLTHVPGGWGVFDVVIVGLLPPEHACTCLPPSSCSA